MPTKSKKQQMFMGAELTRRRAGQGTQTGMNESQLDDFASTKRKGLPVRAAPAQGEGYMQRMKRMTGKGKGK